MVLQTWLPSFIQSSFYEPCEKHSSKKCCFFCRDCRGPTFCDTCEKNANDHIGHNYLRVRKASGHAAIRVDDITELIDVSGIQTFIINHDNIFFINRPLKGNRGLASSSKCETCGRGITSERFCSIACKFTSEVPMMIMDEDIPSTGGAAVSYRKRKRKWPAIRAPMY